MKYLLFKTVACVLSLCAVLTASSAESRLVSQTSQASQTSIFNPIDPTTYPDNMTMVVKLTNGGETVVNAEIGAFINDECRGAAMSEGDGLYYLLIAGQGNGQTIELRVAIEGQIVKTDSSQTYRSDGNVGTPWEPYVIDLTPDAVIGDITGDGTVDVSDYIGIANHIMGNTPQGFDEKAADVNGDGVIDVSDYIGVANIILTGNIYGNQ